jgi:4-amino-4-deoxy-L-arabinose transferase-like glycosyltransferase
VRLLSVAIGTVTVPLLYVTGRRLLGEKGGLLAAALLALSPLHVYYSQEVRMYGLVTLLGLAAFYFTLKWTSANQGVGDWVGYVAVSAAALYTQYYAAFLLLALNLVVLVRWLRMRRPFREIAPWLGAQAAVVALYLPWLWYAGDKLLTYVRFKVSVEEDVSLNLFTYLGRHLAAFNWGHVESSLADYWWLGLVPIAVTALALTFVVWPRARNQKPGDPESGLGRPSIVHHPSSMAFVPCALLLLCGFIVNLVLPFNPPRSERLLLLALPTYLLLIAGALLALWRQRRLLAVVPGGLFLALGLLSLGFFYTTARYPDDDYRPLAARVRALALPSDAIVCIHPWQLGYFQSYIPDDDARPTLVLTPREVIPRERQLWADDPSLMAGDLEALLIEHGRLWLPDHRTMGRVLESMVEAYLAEHSYPVLSEWYGENTVLSLFAAGKPVPQPVTAQFGEWLVLDAVAMNPGPLQVGWDVVTVDLTWLLSERPDERYQVGMRLTDATGRVWAQRDSYPTAGLEHFYEWPVGEPHLDRHGLLLPAGTPPGEYHVTLRVYRSHDLAVLPVAFEGGSGGEVTLGSVKVSRPQTPPPLEALAYEQRLQVGFGERLRLLGINLGSKATLQPGEAVEVELFWQALVDPGEDLLPRLQLLDDTDTVLGARTEKPVAGTYPTAWWRAGELVRDPHTLSIPATAATGRYRLTLSLIRAADDQPVAIKRGQMSVDLAEIEVVAREHRYTPTVPDHIQGARFAASVELVGFDLSEVMGAPGSSLEVTLHWHVLATPDKAYHTFVHLLDAGDNIVVQHDGPPGGGELPTLGWLPGEYLTDTHRLQLPSTLPGGEYRLGVGLYDPATDQRLGDRLLLHTPISIQASGG